MSDTKPWALSPLIATMPHFVHERLDDIRTSPLLGHKHADSTGSSFPPSQSLGEDTSQLQFAIATSSNSSSSTFSTPASSNSMCFTPASSGSAFVTPASSLSSRIPSAASSSYDLPVSSRKPVSLGASVKNSLKKPLEKAQKKSKVDRSLDLRTASDRRSYFSSPQHRQEIEFGPDVSRLPL